MQNFSDYSKQKILAVNEKKKCWLFPRFFSCFKSNELNVSNLGLDAVIAKCLTCLLKELDKRFCKTVHN